MSVNTVRAYLSAYGLEDRVMEFNVSSATVELAAKALGTEPARIAKSLCFQLGESYALVPQDAPVRTYLDGSLRRFDRVYPACGSSSSAIGLTCDELYAASGAEGWVDVSALPDPA